MKKITLGLSAMAISVALGGAAIAAANMPVKTGVTLTRAEAQARAVEAFAKLDINHDGKLDKADRTARESEHFDKMDTNHDGQLSRDEFIAAHEAMRDRMGRGKMRDGMQGGMGHDMPPPAGGMDHGPMGMAGADHKGMMMHRPPMGARMGLLMEVLRIADPQHTGSVTKDAFVNASLQLFDKADANHDGKVTPEERKAAFRAAFGERMPGHWGKHGGKHHGPMDDMPPPPPPANPAGA